MAISGATKSRKGWILSFFLLFGIVLLRLLFEAPMTQVTSPISWDSERQGRNFHGEEKDELMSSKRLGYNSKEWLTGQRLSNSAEGISEEEIYRLIELTSLPMDMDALKGLASPTICHKESNFSNPMESNWDLNDKRLQNEWHFRLIYYAIHHLFHSPAVPEMRARREGRDQESDMLENVTTFDYECPTAKFLVAPYTKNGVGAGAAIRSGIVSTILNAIAMDRIPILLNNVRGENIDEWIQKPSMLVSCERGDLQCFFLPVTPCTITKEQLQFVESMDWPSNTVIDGMAYRGDERIWVSSLRPQVPYSEDKSHSKLPFLARKNLYAAALNVIEQMKKHPSAANDPIEKWKVLQRAAVRILEPYSQLLYESDYHQDQNAMVQAALMYFMRPNYDTHQRIESAVEKILPFRVNRNSSLLGIMIRGSDKCQIEAACLSPNMYQSFVHDVRERTGSKNIILSSEDTKILDFIDKNSSDPVTNFIYDRDDVSPGSGNALLWGMAKVDADRVMLSSLVVLRLQLHSSILWANCCSNFHQVMLDLYKNGCGVAKHGKAHCMNHHRNKDYHMCCVWSQARECASQVSALKQKRPVGILPPKAKSSTAILMKRKFSPKVQKPTTTKASGTPLLGNKKVKGSRGRA